MPRYKFPTRPIAERLWDKINSNTSDKCWPWKAQLSLRGVPQIWCDTKMRKASHVMWELLFGQVPKGYGIYHKCNDTTCMNPDHFYLKKPTGRKTRFPSDQVKAFWSHVKTSGKGGKDECWPFGDYVGDYANFSFNGKMHKAHRFSYELHHGPFPSELYVLHKCDNPPCVNPNHLFLGTHADNMSDMARKGRARSGRTKLTPEQVRQIRADYAAKRGSTYALGRKYGMSSSAIFSIVSYEHWKNVA